MRRKNASRVIIISNATLFLILFLFIFSNIFFSINCKSQGEQILIYITDVDDDPISQITEESYFKISVYDPDLDIDMFLVDVSIEFNDDIYQITEEAPNKEITLSAPEIKHDTDFTIRAFKDELVAETEITVLNKEQLIVTPQELIIDSDTDFYVIVTDGTSENNPVFDAAVYISNIHDQQDTTNENGIVYLHSPEDRDQIRVYAEKDGYEKGYADIKINIPTPFLEEILKNQYFLFFLAFFVLIFVVIFVHFRQKKSIYERTKEITEEKQMGKNELKHNSDAFPNKSDPFSNQSSYLDNIRIKSDSDSKVEEIRISRERKEKEVVPLETREEKIERSLSKRNIKHTEDWFKGKDDIRYEIDKITGEIDEKGKDKWFEGIDSIREKIDEKVKKDKKKQREE